MKEICCERFAKEAELKPMAGGGFNYPEEMRGTQIEFDKKTGKWNVSGCCGGGCYVLTDLVYCPWCGKNIKFNL